MNELEELRIKLATANKVIDQVEEKLVYLYETMKCTCEHPKGEKWHFMECRDEWAKVAKEALSSIQSLKLKGK